MELLLLLGLGVAAAAASSPASPAGKTQTQPSTAATLGNTAIAAGAGLLGKALDQWGQASGQAASHEGGHEIGTNDSWEW